MVGLKELEGLGMVGGMEAEDEKGLSFYMKKKGDGGVGVGKVNRAV